MTLSLKIVVCSLKSVKRLPGVQNDSPVMNTQRESWLPYGEYTWESWLPCGEYNGESRLPYDEYTGEWISCCNWKKHQNRWAKKFLWQKDKGVKTPQCINKGESRLPDVLCTSSFFAKLFRSAPWWWIHLGVTTSRRWIHWKVLTPQGENTRELVMNMNNFLNI